MPTSGFADFAAFHPSAAHSALDFVGGATLGLLPGLQAAPEGQGTGRFARANGAGGVLSQHLMTGTYGVIDAASRGACTGAGCSTAAVDSNAGSNNGAQASHTRRGSAAMYGGGGGGSSSEGPEDRAERVLRGMSDLDQEALLQARWAHDTAWLNLFPDVHNVNIA